MRCGFVFPLVDAREFADLAGLAERSGWDGVFACEPLWGVDAWVSLAAAAMRTERVRLGTMLTPLSRMRPWKLASEAATVHRLSGGRVVVAVGLGAPDSGFDRFAEVTDRRTRAELLDEGLEIVTKLWAGESFVHDGRHYQVRMDTPLPTPLPEETGAIPVWVVGAWGSGTSMRRALRYDGLLPMVVDEDGIRGASQSDITDVSAYVAAERSGPYDIVVEGETPGDDTGAAAETVRPWAEAGATWWIEGMWEAAGQPDVVERVAERLRSGPPVRA